MFSPQIVDSDAFLELPSSSQNLYFHLGMRADDDGFVGNPRKIMKVVGGSEDDLKILIAKRFLLVFENGVVVIKHWRIHNLIRADRYHETVYRDEKSRLLIKDNGSYTEVIPNGNQMATMATEVRLGKVNKEGDSDESHSLRDSDAVRSTKPNSVRQTTEDIEIIPTDEDGNELKSGWGRPKSRPKPQSTRGEAYRALQEVSRVWLRFVELCKKELGKEPIVDAKSRSVIKFAIGKVGEKEVLDIVEEWFTLGKPDEETIQITRCLSGNQLNAHRARQ